MAEVQISTNPIFVRHGLNEKWWCPLGKTQALRYQNYVIPEAASLKDAGVFAYGASLGLDSKLFGTDERKASNNFSDESKQDISKSSRGSSPGYPALGSSNVVIDDD